ncbi:MAG: NUDIX domain-containing protein [Chitinophagales bacterium]
MGSLEFQRSLNKKRMGAGALIRNEAGGILLVQPTYKDNWEVPGGTVEANESPYQACLREIDEELGIEVKINRLICVDYNPSIEGYLESLMFIFDGGILSKAQIAAIRIDSEEHHGFTFVKFENLKDYLGERLLKRMKICFKSVEDKEGGLYLENQERID